MRYDGSRVEQLTDNQWEEGTPAWHPSPRSRVASRYLAHETPVASTHDTLSNAFGPLIVETERFRTTLHVTGAHHGTGRRVTPIARG